MTGPYRVGNHNARHVYRGDQEIAVAFTEDDGRLIADALNAAAAVGAFNAAARTTWPDTGPEWDNAKPYRIYSRWVKAQDRSARAVYAAILEAYAVGLASEPYEPQPYEPVCADEYQSPHRFGSRPNMCATCSGLRDQPHADGSPTPGCGTAYCTADHHEAAQP